MNALKKNLGLQAILDEDEALTLSGVPEGHVVEFIGRRNDDTLLVLCRPEGIFGHLNSLNLYIGKQPQLNQVNTIRRQVSSGALVFVYEEGNRRRALIIPNQYSEEGASDSLLVGRNDANVNSPPPFYDDKTNLRICRKAKIN